jgi:hypothetical protein
MAKRTKARAAKKSRAPSKGKSVIITVADQAMDKIHQLADELASKGMKVNRVMPLTGVIAGLAPEAKMPHLRGVRGVQSVEEEVGIQLPPPSSPVQ